MTKIYTIKLTANLTQRNVFYTAFWNGKCFASTGQPWACLNDEAKARAEFDRVIESLKPEYWQGNYKVELLLEKWEKDKFINAVCLDFIQSQDYED